MCVLLWTISFLALLLTFVLGLGTALGLIGIWGLGAVIFCLVVLSCKAPATAQRACTTTLIDKNYRDRQEAIEAPLVGLNLFKPPTRGLDTTKPPTMPETQQRACRALQPLCWGFLLYLVEESTPTILKTKVSDHSEVLESEELYLTLA